MKFNLKDKLGTGTWAAKWNDEPHVRTCGVESCWYRKDATLDQLLAVITAPGRKGHGNPPDSFEFEEYVKEGRRIVRRVTKQVIVTHSNTM